MKNFMNKVQARAISAVYSKKVQAQTAFEKAREALSDTSGQGALDTAITVLISIVLGALILGGLYLILNATVLPQIQQRIQEMFNYKG
jgi:hypothetical protein